LYVAVADALQIDHRGGDVGVAHPLLKSADVDAVLEVPSSVCLAKFVEQPGSINKGVSMDRTGSNQVSDLVRLIPNCSENLTVEFVPYLLAGTVLTKERSLKVRLSEM
jgi:hypothetical protein